VCLTHDVDRIRKSYQYLTQTAKSLLKGNFKSGFYHFFSIFKKNPYWNFKKIISIERKYKVKSTFFFLNESIKLDLFNPSNWKLSLGRYSFDEQKVKQMIRWLDKNGWEIGLHGSYNSYKSSDLLKKEKLELENILGHEVLGIRQHYLNLNKLTWELQAKAGFRYDASFGFTKKIGFRDKKFRPFHPLKDFPKFTVFPLAIMDSCLMHKENIKKAYLGVINKAMKNNGLLVLNWHQRVFNEREFPAYTKVYAQIIQECKKRGAEFKSFSQVL